MTIRFTPACVGKKARFVNEGALYHNRIVTIVGMDPFGYVLVNFDNENFARDIPERMLEGYNGD